MFYYKIKFNFPSIKSVSRKASIHLAISQTFGHGPYQMNKFKKGGVIFYFYFWASESLLVYGWPVHIIIISIAMKGNKTDFIWVVNDVSENKRKKRRRKTQY